jgi:hypothetical protein
MTPPHHSAHELKNFTWFDGSENVIKLAQLRSEKSYYAFYAHVLQLSVTVLKLCFTNLVLCDQSSTRGI